MQLRCQTFRQPPGLTPKALRAVAAYAARLQRCTISMGLRPRLPADAALALFGSPGLAPGGLSLEGRDSTRGCGFIASGAPSAGRPGIIYLRIVGPRAGLGFRESAVAAGRISLGARASRPHPVPANASSPASASGLWCKPGTSFTQSTGIGAVPRRSKRERQAKPGRDLCGRDARAPGGSHLMTSLPP